MYVKRILYDYYVVSQKRGKFKYFLQPLLVSWKLNRQSTPFLTDTRLEVHILHKKSRKQSIKSEDPPFTTFLKRGIFLWYILVSVLY